MGGWSTNVLCNPVLLWRNLWCMVCGVFVFQSRGALSLLGYCYFHIQDFLNASDCYEQLVQLHPEVEDYKLYYAQALYHACMYPEAMKATFQIENPEYQPKVRPCFLVRQWPAFHWFCAADIHMTKCEVSSVLYKFWREHQAWSNTLGGDFSHLPKLLIIQVINDAKWCHIETILWSMWNGCSLYVNLF